MRMHLIWTILVVVAFGVGSFFVSYKIKISSDFQYEYNIPDFTIEEQSIIKTALCTIVKNLENPERHFVNSITQSDSIVTIEMFPLVALQTWSNSKGKHIVTATGESKRFIFDKKLNLLEIKVTPIPKPHAFLPFGFKKETF